MAHITTNTAVDDTFATWINKKFIRDLTFDLQHQKFTAEATIPDGFGANIGRFVEFAPPIRTGYALGSTAITEASPTANEITSITTTPTNVTVAEYGEFLKFGQLYEMASVSTTRERTSKRLRDGGLVSIDTVVRGQSVTSTNVWYASAAAAGGSATAATPTVMGASTLIGGRKVLYDALVPTIEGVEGHPDRQYAAVLTPKQELDIVTEVTTSRIYWTNCVVNVPGALGQSKFVNGYIGSVYAVAVYVTQNYQTTTLTSASDIGFMYGADGVAAVGFRQMTPQIILNDLNSPFKNVNTIAWHLYFGAGLVSSTRVLKMYSLS